MFLIEIGVRMCVRSWHSTSNEHGIHVCVCTSLWTCGNVTVYEHDTFSSKQILTPSLPHITVNITSRLQCGIWNVCVLVHEIPNWIGLDWNGCMRMIWRNARAHAHIGTICALNDVQMASYISTSSCGERVLEQNVCNTAIYTQQNYLQLAHIL